MIVRVVRTSEQARQVLREYSDRPLPERESEVENAALFFDTDGGVLLIARLGFSVTSEETANAAVEGFLYIGRAAVIAASIKKWDYTPDEVFEHVVRELSMQLCQIQEAEKADTIGSVH